MNDFLKYYSLTLVFYLFEIVIFQAAIKEWVYDIFWLNIILRMTLVAVFSIIVRNTIFKGSKFFYSKFLVLIIASPLVASILLKILTILYAGTLVIALKVISDLISSLMVFLILKKIN
jgi:hypothetical protein